MSSPNKFIVSLQTKLLASFFAIVVLVILVTLYFVQTAAFAHSQKLLSNNTKISTTLISEHFKDTANVLFKAASNLSSDFSIKKLILDSQDDVESLNVAMRNFTTRFNASEFAVVAGDGAIITTSPDFLMAPLTDISRLATEDITWYINADSVFLAKAVPVRNTPRSRDVMAWLLFAKPAQQLFNEELSQLTQLDVSLMKDAKTMIASTYEKAVVSEFMLNPMQQLDTIQDMHVPSGHYLYMLTPIGNANGATVSLMLSTVEEEAYLSYRSLVSQLIGLLVVISIAVLLMATLIARNISKPILALIEVTDAIGKGDTVNDFPRSDTKEVNTLAKAVSQMHSGLLQRESEINRLAFFDDLSGLPNRVKFIQYLDEQLVLNETATLSLILVDIERFKEVNDSIGHAAGDTLLALVAQRLTQRYHDDVFIARMGSNEFALLSLKGMMLKALMEDVKQCFQPIFMVNEVALSIDVSMGGTLLEADAKGKYKAADLLLEADIALQACKESHHAYLEYSDALNSFSVERLQTMSELKDIVSSQQLSLYYQPKLCLVTNTIENVECLARWIHPEKGFIPPDEFIPLAEQSGAIKQITMWAIETAIAQHAKWREQGIEVAMAVNISAIDLVHNDFARKVVNILSQYQVAPQKLILEVTESAIMSEPEVALQSLNLLSQIGIVVSIDDFGTGFSSMAQLKKLPVNELKIDKAFVLELATNREDQVMVKTLIDLAQNLGLKTVAEGVEDEQSLALLKSMGCTYAQGYFISRPMPVQEANKWLVNACTTNVSRANA
ncbi:EAL domain-containing protein [Glaciecola sp. XM2]|uniref:putative bifunctional diguanylate cyclase/phosphodiesterase n=1 Tax=Glaciecola sp. XM2 TaxID=1914931 RepID=UPI001BDF6A60|nr:bifunctional diguanylate cyclase/phosphodiesterase [Glaciecola sp. XM2]MBT1450209.1 EAL domain-containing protein [Glaciecola sp. XM2]